MPKHKILSFDFNFDATQPDCKDKLRAPSTDSREKFKRNQTDKTSPSSKNNAVKPITYRRLYNVTLYYLSRFDASAGKVRDMLKRKILRTKMKGGTVPSEADEWIEQIILRMQELQYIDDARYGENQVRQLSAQGKSTRFIAMKLAAAGLDTDMIQTLIETAPSDEMNRAMRLVQRKKMGYLRSESERTEYYKKDLAALGRAGFSYETAVKALKGDYED